MNYELHDLRSTSHPDYARAISLYADSIPREVRTNTNEISMWLDRYNQSFAPDQFHVMALTKDDEVIGYCQYVAMAKEKLIIVDYIAIGKAHRRGVNVYCTFMKLLKEWGHTEFPGYDVVLEAIDLPVYGRRFEELLRRTGFAAMPFPYQQQALGDMAGELNGKLMIYPAREVDEPEYSRIHHCITHDHYARWYSYLH
jgi:hypothetical protein